MMKELSRVIVVGAVENRVRLCACYKGDYHWTSYVDANTNNIYLVCPLYFCKYLLDNLVFVFQLILVNYFKRYIGSQKTKFIQDHIQLDLQFIGEQVIAIHLWGDTQTYYRYHVLYTAATHISE